MDTSEALESISRLPGRKPDIIECPDVATALDTAYKQADKQLIIVTGSLYLVGEVRSLLH
jgi:folylpolyglutamate synthase/dihydropteroate synthase